MTSVDKAALGANTQSVRGGGPTEDAAEPLAAAAPFTPTPFKPSWLGVVMGIGLGGGIGAVAGAAMLGSGGGYGGAVASTATVLGVALVTGLIGAAIGGGIAYGSQQSSHNKEQAAKQDVIVGTPIAEYAASVMAPYDHSHNQQIELTNESKLEEMDERFIKETRRVADGGHWGYDIWDDDLDYITDYVTEYKATSAVGRWNAANSDGDKLIPQSELEQFLADSFDQNKDGHLQAGERAAYEAAHPVVVTDWHR